jgi:hypothetical protein
MNRWTVWCVALGFCLPSSLAFALGGTLDRPGLSVPVKDEQRDAVVFRLHEILYEHQAQFVTGHFVNAHSTMSFLGSTDDLSKLLAELSAVEGATISLRFSKARGEASSPFAKDQPAKPSRWEIEHNAWSESPRKLTITVFLGDGAIDLEKLVLPDIVGRKPQPPSTKLTPQ